MQQTVVGVFDHHSAAQRASELLQQRGIDDDDIRITSAGDGTIGSTGTAGSAVPDEDKGVLQRIRDFFSGEDNDDVGVYSEHLRRGGAVLKVEVEDDAQVEVAREVLETAGAVDIDARVSEWQAGGWSAGTGTSATAAALGTTTGVGTTAAGTSATLATDAASDVLPVVREELQVGKRTVRAGGIRVYSRIVEEAVHESVSLREERARVERRPVDRPATEAELGALGERTIEVEENVERPVVQKVARVVEEVVVGKDVREKTVSIDDTLRHTEVNVEQMAGTSGTLRSYDEFATQYRSDFDTRYGASGQRFEDVEPAYRYGHTLAGDSRYAGKRWEDIESDVGRDWSRDHPGSAWEKMKAGVRHAWERATS